MSVDVAALYERYGPMVVRRCRALLKDEELAVDAMHDVFVRVVEKSEQLDLSTPSSLLYTIATRICLNRLRSQKRKPEDVDDRLLYSIAAHDESAGTIARILLPALFRKQAASTGTIAVLHYVDGMPLEDVADIVGMSVSGVRKRLRKLRFDVNAIVADDNLEVRDV